MQVVEVTSIAKSFGSTQAVADVSFTVERGEIFGLLGPNGAGKTTTIRIILDIFKPDSGSVAVLGGSLTEEKKALIGYMPEERGLYEDIPLDRCLSYFGALKGLASEEVNQRLQHLLERFDLAEHRTKKVSELSKGMQQKAQIITTILHQPELIIIDEPFTALDPINTQMVKDLMGELREGGATIIMSTHQMHQVEELCDRILLIDDGYSVLYGDLEDIRRQFTGHAVIVRVEGELPEIPGVEEVSPQNNIVRLDLSQGTTPQDVLNYLVKRGVSVSQFEIAVPGLDEIFIRVVEAGET